MVLVIDWHFHQFRKTPAFHSFYMRCTEQYRNSMNLTPKSIEKNGHLSIPSIHIILWTVHRTKIIKYNVHREKYIGRKYIGRRRMCDLCSKLSRELLDCWGKNITISTPSQIWLLTFDLKISSVSYYTMETYIPSLLSDITRSKSQLTNITKYVPLIFF